MSKGDVFGREQLLAIAALLSAKAGDSADTQHGKLELETAQQSILLFIELCAKALLKRSFEDFEKVDATADGVSKIGNELLPQIPRSVGLDALSGAFWLMSVYESLVGFKLELQDAVWCLIPSHLDRKKRGQYFTPRNLTQLATQSALQRLVDLRFEASQEALELPNVVELRIVDPAMGAGAFLVCALDFLAAKLNDCGWLEIAENCLYGVDQDEIAQSVTRTVIAFYCACKLSMASLPELPNLSKHLKTGNSLIGVWTEKDANVGAEIEDLNRICFDAIAGSSKSLESKVFHWQYEFSDVMSKGGFDAVLSNPPWEIFKPTSRGGCSESDKDFFDAFNAYLQLSKKRARELETKYGVTRPFKEQGGSDLNAYKLFTELAFCLLSKNGCMSLIVPSGIYTDQGSKSLRGMLFDEGHVFEIISCLNKDSTFAIHQSFNFCILSVCKQLSNGSINVSFGNQNASQLTRESLRSFVYPLDDLQTFSPNWRNLLEVSSKAELQVLQNIYSQANSLSKTVIAGGGSVRFKREFDLTNDSHTFVTRDQAITDGYQLDRYGNYLKGNWQSTARLRSEESFCVSSFTGDRQIRLDDVENVLLPVYEGRMVGQFDCRQKAYISGTGRSAIWKSCEENATLIQSQYLMPLAVAKNRCDLDSIKLGYLAVGSSTNVRTMIATSLRGVPCGNSVPVLFTGNDLRFNLAFLACLNSFVFDFVLRAKMTGNNINYYLLEDCPLPGLDLLADNVDFVYLAALLSFRHPRFARERLKLFDLAPGRTDFMITDSPINRVRIRAALDAFVASAYGLRQDDLAKILDTESETMKGFWRVDKTKQKSTRHTTLTLKFFEQLEGIGATDFARELFEQLDRDQNSLFESRESLERETNNLDNILRLPV